MSKFHNDPMISVELNYEELWEILKLFRDGELSVLSPELEQRFIMGYHEANVANVKSDKGQRFAENPIGIEEALEVAETSNLPEDAINAGWLEYLAQIQLDTNVKNYEPISYPRFVEVLEIYAQRKRLSDPAGMLLSPSGLKLNMNDWEAQNFNQGLEELQEMKAELEADETIPQHLRVEAVNLSIKAIEEIVRELDAQNVQQPQRFLREYPIPIGTTTADPEDPNSSSLILMDMDARAAFRAVKRAVEDLHEVYKADFEKIQAANELEIPLGETLEEGRMQATCSMLNHLDTIEEKFKLK